MQKWGSIEHLYLSERKIPRPIKLDGNVTKGFYQKRDFVSRGRACRCIFFLEGFTITEWVVSMYGEICVGSSSPNPAKFQRRHWFLQRGRIRESSSECTCWRVASLLVYKDIDLRPWRQKTPFVGWIFQVSIVSFMVFLERFARWITTSSSSIFGGADSKSLKSGVFDMFSRKGNSKNWPCPRHVEIFLLTLCVIVFMVEYC